VGTGGPRQTVIGTGNADGPVHVVPSPQKIPGVSHQTVYTPSGGVTVLVGTGNILKFSKTFFRFNLKKIQRRTNTNCSSLIVTSVFTNFLFAWFKLGQER
jgi:hypothetical protein